MAGRRKARWTEKDNAKRRWRLNLKGILVDRYEEGPKQIA